MGLSRPRDSLICNKRETRCGGARCGGNVQYAAGCALLTAMSFGTAWAAEAPAAGTTHPIVLHAAHLLEIDTGRLVTPGEVLVEGERIAAAGSSVPRPSGAQVIDLGGSTLMPGLIDAHVHLFLHPGAEDLQT